jgi:excisionase family DNA binding protein
MESEYLSYAQAGALMSVGRSTVIRLVNAGQLPVVYVSPRRPRILKSDLDAYLERQRRVITPEADDEPKV